ncbi:FecCD family ABC transporter permease [Streptomyces clavuligerus]|uniref:Cobalamin/Fe3+-siderophores transport system, permease component n=1 Tax=Streptomyces clavuligerus TaxID=1901 RepID=E2Q8E2_STRCL|nr:iron chelate uptake ABC transporter family permease subunit [Streptomyces clavuligerus]ANW21380.1 iron ABC transporter permease [Streptomyces clavuligerus]AXU16012.1 iron-enterobactin ABC transporter permease [Streptomyces clavuligerus]EFG05474.1 Cobalamin/Fe3+-siderophores transport system, permease component [Streptomyces clavuligerus]MBY6306147.1 iron chelate uptake ABC transporter family permease subunit [Streptomyces clavuligerus]QCS08791.1 iron-enterobactin ABC transporter permease [S
MNRSTSRPEPIDFGHRQARLRVGGLFAARVSLRSLAVALALTAVALGAAVLSLGFGDYPLTPLQVVRALAGQGDDFHRLIVAEWRLPMAIGAILFGALLGIGGAIFQSLTRNPLGSPDVIGFDAGAYTGVVLTTVLIGSHHHGSVATAAIAGGLLTAGVVQLLSSSRRGAHGFRLIVVGIAVSAMLQSITSYLITRADIDDAMSVGFWAAGSLNRVGWDALVPSLIGGALVLACVSVLAPALRQLELGDDAATAQGVDTARARPVLLIVGVAATALVTAAAGPIAFVALAAPQLARRLTRTPGVTVASAAFLGAALVSLAHTASLAVAQAYRPVPVGLITVCVGGLYLIQLLIRETRRSI